MRIPPLLLFMIAGIAQAAPALTIQSLPYQGKDKFGHTMEAKAISMPWVTSGASPAGMQINVFLFLELFNGAAPKQPGKALSARDVSIEGLATQDFTVLRNDERVVTIEFNNEGCGAYCSSYTHAYSFDSKTGRALSSDDLFTQTGKAALARQFNAKRSGSYRKQLAELAEEVKQAKSSPPDKEAREELETKIEMNQECLDNILQQAPRPNAAAAVAVAVAAAQFDDSGYTFDKTGLSMHAGSCFRHAIMALDDVGEVTLTVPYKNLAPHLTPYGQALLLAQGAASAPDNVFGHLLQGQIGGKTAITMLLRKDGDNSVSGHYYYEKYRKPLELSGSLKDGVLSLKESASDDATDHPTLTLHTQGGRLVGTWTGNIELSVDVGP